MHLLRASLGQHDETSIEPVYIIATVSTRPVPCYGNANSPVIPEEMPYDEAQKRQKRP